MTSSIDIDKVSMIREEWGIENTYRQGSDLLIPADLKAHSAADTASWCANHCTFAEAFSVFVGHGYLHTSGRWRGVSTSCRIIHRCMSLRYCTCIFAHHDNLWFLSCFHSGKKKERVTARLPILYERLSDQCLQRFLHHTRTL